MIELRLLQAAVTVEEERNVTRAADRLGLTQPALSKQLAELEERLGFVLFERSSQRFQVTEGGAAFVEHARIALAEVERAVQAGTAASHGSDSILCIVKSPIIDPYFVSMMGSIRLPLHPSMQVRFSSHFSSEALRRLRSGEAHLAVTSGLDDPKGVTSTKLGEDWLYAVLQSDDDLSNQEVIRLSDLHGRRLALLERNVNPPVYDRLRQIMLEDGVHPAEIQHVQQAEEAAALLIQRGCVSILTKTGAWRIMDDPITIWPVSDQRLVLKTYLSARLQEQSRLVSDFTRALKTRLQRRPEQLKLPRAG